MISDLVFSRRKALLLGLGSAALQGQRAPATPVQVSGVYPHLAMFNGQNECGTGAVVPWAGKLWVVTYSPHQPGGSDDKLYEIDAQLNQTVRKESIGGTPANRMIHAETKQLLIGPYLIDSAGKVRVIPYTTMFGRPTGNARHLTDPARKIYYATMEEGFYEVDLTTLAVRMLYEDANAVYARKEAKDISGPLLPGYHGKGFYSGQGRVVYSNNGEIGGGNLPPDIPSGCLAEWDGKVWKVIRRAQFTEVTGPGGISGNPKPATDPIWSIGWDHRSLILMMLDQGTWHEYRLPKAAHTYDGAHGWNTEWPRIREIGERDLLMTMHGMFWRFPKSFSAANSAGIAPHSTYLRVIGDFARWGDRIVFGCDDTAKAEFFNTRDVKGKIAGPGQSQSNLWFVAPARLADFGAPLGRGGVWVRDDVKSGQVSAPFLFQGFRQRMVHLTHQSATAVAFTFQLDRAGNGKWTDLRTVNVSARGYAYSIFDAVDAGAWVRCRANSDANAATVFFQYATPGSAAPVASRPAVSGGLVWARGENKRSVLFLARAHGSQPETLYELNADMSMKTLDEPAAQRWMKENLTPPANALGIDAASVVYTDEKGARWRLPKGDPSFDAQPPTPVRVAREASTERDLFNAHGTFYELPSNNAGGMAMVRPVTTHNCHIEDYCSWRGLLILSGIDGGPRGHVIRSTNGQAGLWAGVSDDLWQFGKPRGVGGPWKDSVVVAGTPSDPYLMTGFDQKLLRLNHKNQDTVQLTVEIDITGTGLWVTYLKLDVPAGKTVEHRFPDGFQAYWVRMVSSSATVATAVLTYS